MVTPKAIETGAEQEDLPHAFVDHMARGILREPAAHRDEQAQTSPLRTLSGEGYGAVGVWAQN